ncbi:hypothetical protein BH10PSE14_BH10PSE14_16580 [soil metagenome]
MKFIAFVSAALVATAALSAAPAAAERWHGGHRTAHHKGHGWKWKKVCKTRYYHGHKGTWCRNVRVRR